MELQSHEIVGQASGPRLLVTGGVHGDEFEPMAAIRRLIREIDPQRLKGCVTLIPVVNEAAFRLGQRVAEDGLDLARTCPGRSEGSVTEQIAAALSTHIQAADYYIDLHTGGTRLRVLPLAGYTLHRDPAVLEVQRRMARAFGLPIVWGTDPNLNGRSLSVARDAGVPAIYTEYHGGGTCDPQGVEAYVAGVLAVLAELGMLDRPPVSPFASQVLIEDDRPGAGHLQVNHPAPCEGFFEASFELGQNVSEGDCLGTVCDPLGNHAEPVFAKQSGILLVLHTYSRVNAGDSLAVVLETHRTMHQEER